MAELGRYDPEQVNKLYAEQRQRIAELEADNERLRKIIRRMIPKLRKHHADEYIIYELIRGESDKK